MKLYRNICFVMGLLLLCFSTGCSKNVSSTGITGEQIPTEKLNGQENTGNKTSKGTESEDNKENKDEMRSEDEKMSELHSILPTKSNVKMLGRTYLYKDTVWCALSATGVEFTLTGKKCEIIFAGDNMASFMSGKEHYARVAVYVDGELSVDEFIKKSTQTLSVYESQEQKTVTIRVVKLSESSDSTVGIKEIRTDAESIAPTATKEVRIEYIGDSITCGYGVDGVLGDTYATSNEDATKAYAYLSAQAVDADYSLVSFSGHGIISGYTGDGTIQDKQLVPPYYTKLGNSYGNFASELAPSSIEWDFSEFVPDVIVINLGTNDSSYCGTDEERCLAYQTGYIEFLKNIRDKNADATILCTLGVMGDSLYPYVEAAVTEYSKETGDTKVETMHFEQQKMEDGYAVDYHPSAVSQQKAADQLTERLQTIIDKRAEEAKQFQYDEIDVSWIDPDKKLVAFAFDDGPVSWSENSSAMQILKTLEQYGQHATFFYVGQNINESSKQEIEYAQKIGCEIANHTWTHPFLTKLTQEQIKEEVEKTRAKLSEITAIHSFLLRLPYINYNQEVLEAINVPCISASVDSGDWNNGTYDSVVERMLAADENGSLQNAIILMHENYSFTADAVSYLVPYFLEKGYQIVSVSELAKVRGTQLEAGNVYSSIE